MQKMKKVLISLLACLCVGTAACGFAACKDDENAGTGGTGTGGLGGLGGLGGGGNTDDGNTDDGNTDDGNTENGGNAGATAQVMVMFDAGYGEFENEADSVQVVNVNSTLTMPTPTRQGYVLNGWQLANGTKWDATQTVTTNVTLYAIWKKDVQEYDVRFNLNYEGAETVTLSTEEGKVTYIPEREGYVFRGWWQSNGSSYDGVYELTTKFNMNTVVTSDGLELYAEWVEEDKASAYLSAPVVSVSGTTFTWNEVEGAYSYSVRVYSSYYSSYVYETTVSSTSWDFYDGGYGYGTYTVYVRANGDGETKLNSSYNSLTYKYGMLDSVTGIALDPFTSLLTWNGVENADYYELYIDGSYVSGYLYETKYDMSNYTVGSYNVSVRAYDNGGYQYSYANAYVNKVKLNTPTGLDCTFDLEDNEYTFYWNSVSSADEYELSLNGSTYTTSSTSYTINGEDIAWNDDNEVLYTVKAKGAGTYLNSDVSYEYSQDKVIVASVSISNSVKVVNDSYLVEFYKNDGTTTKWDSQYVTETVGLEYPALPTRSGYVFKGWYTESSCENVYDFTSEVTEDMTLYASWEEMVSYYNYRDLFNPITQYNSASNYYSHSTSGTSSTYSNYLYFQALTSGTYTLYYKNYRSSSYTNSSYYSLYMDVYNATQDSYYYSTVYVNPYNGYYSYDLTVNAGDVIYIRTYRYNTNSSSYYTTFYAYVTGAQMPADGGLASGIDYAETTDTMNAVTKYYELNDYATISTVMGTNYVFDGWYDENDQWVSNSQEYSFYVTEEEVSYTAKWTVNKSEMAQGTSFADAIVATTGGSYDIDINTVGEWKYFVFTPTTTGYYSFYSDNLSGDSHAYLYDSNYNDITNDDDSNGNLNFKISYTLTAGYTYYIRVGEHGGNETCSFTFHIVYNY